MPQEIAWIMLVNIILYCKTLRYKFVSDDFSVFFKPPEFKNEWHKRWLQITGQCKLKGRSYHFGKGWVETEEQEHLLALIIHIGIGIAIFYAFGATKVSFLAALLFSVNPVNNQATIWPAGRGYALPILFLMLSLAIPILTPIFLFGCAWYTVGFLAPLTLIGSHITNWLICLPIIWLLHAKKFRTAVKNKSTSECFTEDRVIHPRKLILGIKTFGFYLFLCLIPFRITFYHNFLQSAAGSMKHKCYTFCRYFWFGLFSLTGIITYAVMTPWNSLSWALCAFCIGVLPFCNLVRANQEIAERFVALPNVFLMYALAQIIFKLGG